MGPKASLERFPQSVVRERRMDLHTRQKEWPKESGGKSEKSVVCTMDRVLQKQEDPPRVLRKTGQHVLPFSKLTCSLVYPLLLLGLDS